MQTQQPNRTHTSAQHPFGPPFLSIHGSIKPIIPSIAHANHRPNPLLDQHAGFRNEPAQQQQQATAQPLQNAASSSSWAGLLNQADFLQESLMGSARTAQFINSLDTPDSRVQLPAFIRPLSSKIASEDVAYLHAKGALTLPDTRLQNAFLQAYVEYVHPYMPLMDLHDFLGIINCRDGLNGQVSLFLYHAVMFAATAFVDRKYLREAGYATRKAARKSYFQKTRVCLPKFPQPGPPL
jgi:hypothetical protein